VSLTGATVIFGAGLVAGLINSVAGGGTLLSFPTLVWMGRDPIVANITNAVALWPGSLASVIGFRRELRGGRRLLFLLMVPSVLGALTGAILLLHTPSRTFAIIVPYLVLFATLLFAAQSPIMRYLHHRSHWRPPADGPTLAWSVGAVIFQFFVAIYGGYFGAGIGIVMLAALGLLGLTDIHHMNGLKNAFAVCINAVAAVYFAARGDVAWIDALLMAAGAIVGGYAGAGLARRVGRGTVRRAVVVIGVAMTVSLLLRRP
jgi:uncharacterized membrane protein YfcA